MVGEVGQGVTPKYLGDKNNFHEVPKDFIYVLMYTNIIIIYSSDVNIGLLFLLLALVNSEPWPLPRLLSIGLSSPISNAHYR
jgi:hypothetical protein